MDSRSVGVEEEFLLVEPDTGRPKAVAGTVLQAAGPEAGTDLEGELQQQQLETNSRRQARPGPRWSRWAPPRSRSNHSHSARAGTSGWPRSSA
jgi:carboxylate-amine ligase